MVPTLTFSPTSSPSFRLLRATPVILFSCPNGLTIYQEGNKVYSSWPGSEPRLVTTTYSPVIHIRRAENDDVPGHIPTENDVVVFIFNRELVGYYVTATMVATLPQTHLHAEFLEDRTICVLHDDRFIYSRYGEIGVIDKNMQRSRKINFGKKLPPVYGATQLPSSWANAADTKACHQLIEAYIPIRELIEIIIGYLFVDFHHFRFFDRHKLH